MTLLTQYHYVCLQRVCGVILVFVFSEQIHMTQRYTGTPRWC